MDGILFQPNGIWSHLWICLEDICIWTRAHQEIQTSLSVTRHCEFVFKAKQRNSTDLVYVPCRASPLRHQEFQQNDVWIWVLQFMIQAWLRIYIASSYSYYAVNSHFLCPAHKCANLCSCAQLDSRSGKWEATLLWRKNRMHHFHLYGMVQWRSQSLVAETDLSTYNKGGWGGGGDNMISDYS